MLLGECELGESVLGESELGERELGEVLLSRDGQETGGRRFWKEASIGVMRRV